MVEDIVKVFEDFAEAANIYSTAISDILRQLQFHQLQQFHQKVKSLELVIKEDGLKALEHASESKDKFMSTTLKKFAIYAHQLMIMFANAIQQTADDQNNRVDPGTEGLCQGIGNVDVQYNASFPSSSIHNRSIDELPSLSMSSRARNDDNHHLIRHAIIVSNAASETNNGNDHNITNDGITKDEEQDWSHITEADLELKEFQCPRCSNVFKTTRELYTHMRETYAKPEVCHVCGKNFKTKNCINLANLLHHSYIHRNIKPYHCPKCNYQGRTRGNLQTHFGRCAKVVKFMDRGYKSKYERYKYQSMFLREKVKKCRKVKDDVMTIRNQRNHNRRNSEYNQRHTTSTNTNQRARLAEDRYYRGGDEKDLNVVIDKHQCSQLSNFIDWMTGEVVVKPAVSPSGYVLGYDSWTKVLRSPTSRNKCPFTRQSMTRRSLVKLTDENYHEFKDKIVNFSQK